MTVFRTKLEESGIAEQFRKATYPINADAAYTLNDAIADYVAFNPCEETRLMIKQRQLYIEFVTYLAEDFNQSPEFNFIDAMKFIRDNITDMRDKSKVIYPLDFLIMLIVITRIQGIITPAAILNYYRRACLEFFVLLPGCPPLNHRLSESTIKLVIQMVDAKELKEFFKVLFTKVKYVLTAQQNYNQSKYILRDDNLKDTIAFDGQEEKASYRKGNPVRKCKGGNVTTLFDCTNSVSVDFAMTDRKNQERTVAIDTLFANTAIKGNIVMSDALNAQGEVTKTILKAGGDYLFPIKKNSNKELRSHLEGIFNRNQNRVLQSTSSQKDHGRFEESIYEVLPAQEYLDPRIENNHEGLNTIVRYVKTTHTINNGKVTNTSTHVVRYYISSLDFNGGINILEQVKASIEDYWFIEEHHSILDDERIFNQDNLNACYERTLSNQAAFNKIGHNILAYIRQRMTKKEERKKPVPFGKSHDSNHKIIENVNFADIRALIVDDNESDREYIQSVAKHCGIKADVVKSSNEALKQIEIQHETQSKYNLCILDWSMPDTNGIDLAKKIKELYKDEMPIIIATAYDISQLTDEASKIGVAKVISKPLFQSTMMDILVNNFGNYINETKADQEFLKINLSGFNILIAEDNPMNMEIAVALLQKVGAHVVQTQDGQQAYDLFISSHENEFDVILMDIQMPILNGYQATTIPIIAVTANAFTEDVNAAIASGMNDHVAKPIDVGELYQTLCKHVNTK